MSTTSTSFLDQNQKRICELCHKQEAILLNKNMKWSCFTCDFDLFYKDNPSLKEQ
jgi:hypothetical protein